MRKIKVKVDYGRNECYKYTENVRYAINEPTKGTSSSRQIFGDGNSSAIFINGV